MSKEILHAINIKNVTTYSIFGLLLGIILTFIPVSTLVDLLILIVGFTMIIVNGYSLYIEFRERKETTNDTLISVVGILLGFVLVMVRHSVVSVIVALYLMALPIVDIIKARGDKTVILDKLPKIVLGLIVLFGGFIVIDVIFKVIGIVVMVGSILYLAYNYYLYKKSGVKVIK